MRTASQEGVRLGQISTQACGVNSNVPHLPSLTVSRPVQPSSVASSSVHSDAPEPLERDGECAAGNCLVAPTIFDDEPAEARRKPASTTATTAATATSVTHPRCLVRPFKDTTPNWPRSTAPGEMLPRSPGSDQSEVPARPSGGSSPGEGGMSVSSRAERCHASSSWSQAKTASLPPPVIQCTGSSRETSHRLALRSDTPR